MITTLVSLYMFLIAFTNSPQAMAQLPHDTKGEYYVPAQVEYRDGMTYAVWVRYYVWGEKYGQYGAYNVTPRGGQVWAYKGTVSKEDVKKEGRSRADAYIVVDVQ